MCSYYYFSYSTLMRICVCIEYFLCMYICMSMYLNTFHVAKFTSIHNA